MVIIKPSPERLLKMQASSKIFIKDKHGNILQTWKEIRDAVHELDIEEADKARAATRAKVEEFKKRCGA